MSTTTGDDRHGCASEQDEIASAVIAHRICAVDDMQVGEARRFDVGGERIAVVRAERRWYAIGDLCSHADFSLAEGDVDLDECTLECIKHGSLFSLETGIPETLPATVAVATFDLVVTETEVAVMLPSSGATPDNSEAEPGGSL